MSAPAPASGPQIAVVVEELFGVPAASLSPELELADGLQLDSLAVIELQVAIEDLLDVSFESVEPGEIVTYGDLVATVDRLRAP